MAAIGLLAAGVLVILLAVLGSWVMIVGRRSIANGVTEEQARQNAAPLTTAILSPRTRERTNR